MQHKEGVEGGDQLRHHKASKSVCQRGISVGSKQQIPRFGDGREIERGWRGMEMIQGGLEQKCEESAWKEKESEEWNG